MRATVFEEVGRVALGIVPDAVVLQPDDVVVSVRAAGVCGTDLSLYSGKAPAEPGQRLGHEFVGTVEDVGSLVRSLRRGDFVIAPFGYSDGSCDACLRGLPTSCKEGGFWAGSKGEDGGQGEAVRVPYADRTLVKAPSEWLEDDAALSAALALCDVGPTGEHGAGMAEVGSGDSVLVVGDGAVGLAAVAASARRGAATVMLLGHHDDRLVLAASFGATAVARTSAPELRERLVEQGPFDAVIECVGNARLVAAAVEMVRPGGQVAYVGIPSGALAKMDLQRIFMNNIGVRGGITPVANYLPDMVRRLEAGDTSLGRLFTFRCGLEQVAEAYAKMARRQTLKSMLVL